MTRRVRRYFLNGLAVLAAALLFGAWASGGRGLLEVHFLDVGQGDAIYVRAPNGNDMLIDSGASPSVLRRLGEAMPWHDRDIDVLLETHPDQDHIGGMPDIIERYDVGMFVMPGVESANSTDDEIDRLLTEKSVPVILGRRGMRLVLGGGAYFDLLFPDSDPTKLATNDASIVGRLVYGSTFVMLTGDSPKWVEERLVGLDGTEGLASQVLKAGHHGSKTSSAEAFVTTVDPDFAIISAGKDNRYGHPNKEVVETFRMHSIPMFRTDEEGTIIFVSDGKRIWRKRKRQHGCWR